MSYFSSRVMRAAANDYIKSGMAYDLSDFVSVADVDPAWELEVICAYIDKQLNLALLKDFKLEYPKMPEIK
jgi:hypothetical protein